MNQGKPYVWRLPDWINLILYTFDTPELAEAWPRVSNKDTRRRL
jgi:hypothetical protein